MALLNAGYWQTTYWPSRYWDPSYWPKYGTAVPPAVVGDTWGRPVPKPPLPIHLFTLVKQHLEVKVHGDDSA